MGGSSGGSGTGEQTVTSRYAKYIEDIHETFLEDSEYYSNNLRDDSPYWNHVDGDFFDFTDGLYGSGYTLASFPSLFDMYGKFQAGLDVEALFEEVLGDVQDSDTMAAAVSAHRDILDDDIEQNVLPRFRAGMRDINAVQSSSYAIGMAIIEQGRNKKVAEFDADLRYKLIPVAAEVFAKHLSWNTQVITTYIEIMKTAVAVEMDTEKLNLALAQKQKLWPFYVFEYHRANLGALQGAVTRTASEEQGGGSTLGNVIGGASMGASVGGLPGAIIGGIAGAFF